MLEVTANFEVALHRSTASLSPVLLSYRFAAFMSAVFFAVQISLPASVHLGSVFRAMATASVKQP